MVNKTLKGTLLCTVALAGGLLAQNTTANADTITVKVGDTLSSLALTHNTTVSSLKETNHLQDENKIFVGDKLETSTNVNQDNNTYTVVAGDTLSKIADEHNLTVANLKAYNNLTSDLIMVGQVLQLAGQTSTVDNTPAQTQTQNDTQQTQTAVAQPQNDTQPQQPQQTQQTQTYTQPQQAQTTTSQLSGSEEQAKAWIASKESGGSYDARNGRYVGKYQLDSSYLHGDYSAENQERTAQNYIQSRYGTWQNAQQFWINNGWY